MTKNKVAPPFRQAEFDILSTEKGISRTGEILDLGLESDFVQKSGAFYKLGSKLLGQGREATKLFLSQNSKVAQEIEKKIWQKAQAG